MGSKWAPLKCCLLAILLSDHNDSFELCNHLSLYGWPALKLKFHCPIRINPKPINSIIPQGLTKDHDMALESDGVHIFPDTVHFCNLRCALLLQRRYLFLYRTVLGFIFLNSSFVLILVKRNASVRIDAIGHGPGHNGLLGMEALCGIIDLMHIA